MGGTRLTKAQIERALAAWKAEVGAVGALHVMPDGSIRVEAPVDRPADRTQDSRKPDPWT